MKRVLIGIVALLVAWAAATAAALEAREILAETGVRGGLVAHVGCGDGTLTAALRANERYLVHGLDADAALVKKARAHVRSVGLYGPVSVERWSGARLPYTDNLVNLLVVEDADAVPAAEIERVLCPGGVAYVKKAGGWAKTVASGPENIDEWTHALHGPDNNAVADDTVVGPPHHLQWVGGPKWCRSHDHLSSVSAAVSSGGRLFYIADEAPAATVAFPAAWHLIARDAFSGVVLWKQPIGPWVDQFRGFRTGPSALARRLVAIDDRVYVTPGYGKPVVCLDAATGEVVGRYQGTDNTREIVCADGVLYLVVAAAAFDTKPDGSPAPRDGRPARPRGRHGRFPVVPPKKYLMAVDAKTGGRLWRKADADTVDLMPNGLAVSGGRVFLQSPEHVICLRATDGVELWRAKRPVQRHRPAWSAPTLVVHGDVVLSADRATPEAGKRKPGEEPGRVRWVVSSAGGQAPPGELIAFSVKDGRELWSSKCREVYNAPVDVLVTDGLVWTGDMVRANDKGITAGLDPMTGEVKRTRPPDKKFFRVGMGHHRCHRNRATSRYLVLGRAGVEFIDVKSGEGIAHHFVRGACQYGVLPCNGLLYAPPHSCACYIRSKLSGFNALAPKRAGVKPGEPPVEKGPAFGKVNAEAPAADGADWPTYRHDPARSGRTTAPSPRSLEAGWQTKLGGDLSALTVAGGRVFVARVDKHAVHALDAADGKRLWSVTAGGRVDSPPTVAGGLAIFGCHDGRVYGVRASDGELVWRVRPTGEDRRVFAYGQLESAWPVPGSVLVEKGVAYFAAGRSSFLDGGITVCAVDAATGKVLHRNLVCDRDPKTGREPQRSIRGTNTGAGLLPDVMSSDGTSLFVRHKRFDRTCAAERGGAPHLYSPAGFLDDEWWHRTYWVPRGMMSSGYGGWPQLAQQVVAGRLLVMDGDVVYGYGRNQYATHGSHVGLAKMRYRLFAAAPKTEEDEKKATTTKGRRRRKPLYKMLWSKQIPIVVRAMAMADETLFVAGPRDDGFRSAKVFRGEGENRLLAVSATDGTKRGAVELGAAPVFDGLAVARGRVYLSTTDGSVRCLGK